MIELPYNEYRVEKLIVNCNEMTIANDEQSIKLPVKVFEFFKLFLKDENQTVDRALAIELLWQGNYPVGKRGYINAMWHIRKVFDDLGVNSDEYFKTLPKVGYKLVALPEPIVTSDIASSSKSTALPFSINNIYIWTKTFIDKVKLKGVYLTFSVLLILLCVSVLVDTYYVSQNKIESVPLNPTKITNFEGIEEHPAISSDGRYMAFEWVRKQQPGQLYIKDLKDESVPLRLLTMVDEEEVSPSWSPDNESIAYMRISVDGNCQLRIRQIITNQDSLIDSGCAYTSYLSGIDWSPNGKYIVFSKKTNNGVALFEFDLNKSTSKQISFPTKDAKDYKAVYSADSKQVAFIRENISSAELILVDKNAQESVLLANKLSIVGLVWEHNQNNIYTNVQEGGKYLTLAINPQTKAEKVIHRIITPNNLSFNYDTSELYFSRHLSQEFISQRSLKDGKEIQRASSSSRDLYGQYVANDGILFISNRADKWDIWLKTANEYKNLTKDLGTAFSHRVSPNGKQFLVTIKNSNDEHPDWYLGTLPGGKLELLGNYAARSINWSISENTIYFASEKSGKSGIFKFDLNTKEIVQLTFNDEIFAVEGTDGHLYVSRKGESGIWQFNQNTKESQLLVQDLATTDFASFFWQNDSIYYISRNKTHDLIKRKTMDSIEQIVSTYPSGTVRKYFGIAPADKQSIMLTLNSINDSDIFALPVSTKANKH